MDLEVNGKSFTLTFVFQVSWKLYLYLVLSSVCGSRHFTRLIGKKTFTYIIDIISFMGLSILCQIFFKYVSISLKKGCPLILT
jgi:hypothetical protein